MIETNPFGPTSISQFCLRSLHHIREFCAVAFARAVTPWWHAYSLCIGFAKDFNNWFKFMIWLALHLKNSIAFLCRFCLLCIKIGWLLLLLSLWWFLPCSSSPFLLLFGSSSLPALFLWLSLTVMHSQQRQHLAKAIMHLDYIAGFLPFFEPDLDWDSSPIIWLLRTLLLNLVTCVLLFPCLDRPIRLH